ncbi:MAG: transposase, partial [Desulfobulbaceae bacterium]|nr:transposase [Desulfobulbaceae bacterium]
MTTSKDSKILSVVHPICCGLDIHKKTIAACLITTNEAGEVTSFIKEFGTFTDDLEKLHNWLLEHECPIVAMESTGIYWR